MSIQYAPEAMPDLKLDVTEDCADDTTWYSALLSEPPSAPPAWISV
jgi:hypothetical protein